MADERAQRLVRWLSLLNERQQPVPIQELAEIAAREFGVSEVTLRHDLAALCSWQGVRKLARGTFGVCEGQPSPVQGWLFSTRLLRRAEAKLGIAGAVAGILCGQPDLRVLLLDAGTTAYYVADLLSERAGLDLIVWTANVAAAYRLAGTRGVSVRLLGGEFSADYASVSGDETVRALRALCGAASEASAPPRYDGTHCVLDVNQVTRDGRLLIDESQERPQKQLMASLSSEVTVVADHGKLFRAALGMGSHEVLRLGDLQTCRAVRLVTDGECPGETRKAVAELFRAVLPGMKLTSRVVGEAVVFAASAEEGA